ncbi:DUF6346 domain-containing protein [Actinosynnema sp. NPDC020468]|uniref:DUF6346 domain-containing protein n=1 Tax=Actinosynnema sp. NPDC020468 TaxID=3154488 RepID=UPI0033FCD4E3
MAGVEEGGGNPEEGGGRRLRRRLHRVFAFLVVPALGYLIGATIFFHFYDRVETGDLAKAGYTAVATACQERGPVTYKGFGYWHRCDVTVTRTADRRTLTADVSFLEPADIGRTTWAVGVDRRSRVQPERSSPGLGMVCLMAFGVLWLLVFIRIAGPVMPEGRRRRRMPIRYRRPEGAD